MVFWANHKHKSVRSLTTPVAPPLPNPGVSAVTQASQVDFITNLF